MEPVLDDFVESPVLTDQQVFILIWTKPRRVFEYIRDYDYRKYFYVLLFLVGVSRAFDRAVDKDMGDTLPLIAVVGLCVVLGGALGWISYYIYAALLRWTGKWLGGEAETSGILRVLAYASLPVILSLVFVMIQIAIHGNALFQAAGEIVSDDPIINIVFFGSVAIELLLAVYSIVLAVVGISVVQGFGIGKAILNALLPILLIVLPLVLIGLFIGVSSLSF